MSNPTNEDRAATLALLSAKAFLECLRVGRLPGRKNSRRALKLATKAFQQHRRCVALVAS